MICLNVISIFSTIVGANVQDSIRRISQSQSLIPETDSLILFRENDIDGLIEKLDARRFPVRREARKELIRLGDKILDRAEWEKELIPFMEKLLKVKETGSLEQKTRIAEIIEEIKKGIIPTLIKKYGCNFNEKNEDLINETIKKYGGKFKADICTLYSCGLTDDLKESKSIEIIVSGYEKASSKVLEKLAEEILKPTLESMVEGRYLNPVILNLASNPSTPSKILDKLSNEAVEPEVKLRVMKHKFTSIKTLERLTKDNDDKVREAAEIALREKKK